MKIDVNDLIFYPEHPSSEKTRLIETTPSLLLEQDAPVACEELHKAFQEDFDAVYAKYLDKRYEITGIAIEVGPDVHNKPSIQLSESVDGECHALCIFPKADFYEKVKVGDRVTIRGNYLVYSNLLGIVMKFNELVSVVNN